MVFEVVYELCPVHQLGPVGQGRVELGGRHVALVALDVLLVVPAQAVPGGGVEQEGHALQHDGQAHVQVAVGRVVVQHAGALVAAVGAPEQAGGVDGGAEDQRRRDEACRTGRGGGALASDRCSLYCFLCIYHHINIYCR